MVHSQEAEGHSHDGGFVQVGGHSAWERQSVGKFIKDLGLLTPPASGCITRAQFSLFCAGPGGRRRGR